MEQLLLTGNEAVALAARDGGVRLGTGYPGTPSTEILENFDRLGGNAQWAPNEKVALEVGLGAAYGRARTLVTMKHVGVNVAADPLFSASHTGVPGALVLAVADDPGMHSSQNEQDTRRYAEAAGIPLLEPCDSQEAYDFTLLAITLSERWETPVLVRMTTRICHSKTLVKPRTEALQTNPAQYERDIPARVMIPAYARAAHVRLRDKLKRIADWNESEGPCTIRKGGSGLGIITASVTYVHACEAAPDATICKVGMSYPLPVKRLAEFAAAFTDCRVLEEGDPVMETALKAEGVAVQGKPEMFRFGELNVDRVKRILANDTSAEPKPVPGKPPRLCPDCPHRVAFQLLAKHKCIVAGDIGCYTLGVLPPFEAMDTCACMGASIGVGLGLRHVLPRAEARRVVSVIGDSTFVHSGLTGLAEMAYNPPPTGHVVLILDNGTTAMTGLQEHPGTGRRLNHDTPSNKLNYEALALSLGIRDVHTCDPVADPADFEQILCDALKNERLTLIVARKPCPLSSRRREKQAAACEEAKAEPVATS